VGGGDGFLTKGIAVISKNWQHGHTTKVVSQLRDWVWA